MTPLKPAVAARIAWITWAVSMAFFATSIFLFATRRPTFLLMDSV